MFIRNKKIQLSLKSYISVNSVCYLTVTNKNKNYCFMFFMAKIKIIIDAISMPLIMLPILAFLSDSFVFIT